MLLNLRHYYRPGSIEEAVDLLRDGGSGTVALAGGTTLVASGRLDVSSVVDLRDLDLSYVRVTGATLHIGATTTLQQLVDHPDMQTFASGVLAEMARAVAGRNIRHAATVGGRVASARADDPLLTALLALDAQLTLYAPQARQIPLDSFMAYRQRLLGDGALITQVGMPLLIGPLGAAYVAVGRTPRDRPIVLAVARMEVAHNVAGNVRLALGGVDRVPVRARRTEEMLERKTLSNQQVEIAAREATAGLTPAGDFRGSSSYRLAMVPVLARRALLEARDRAQALDRQAE